MTTPSATTTAADPQLSVKHGKQRCVRLRQGRAGTAPILYRGFCQSNALVSREVTIWQWQRQTMMMVTVSAAALLMPMNAGGDYQNSKTQSYHSLWAYQLYQAVPIVFRRIRQKMHYMREWILENHFT
jgi:hypothetical protein